MPFAQPAYVVAEAGQDISVTVSVAADTTGWTMTAKLRANLGSTVLATGTIVNTPGSTSTVVVTFAAADLSLDPGAYVWQLERTNAGFAYPIIDPSTFRIVAASADSAPQLTNLSDYLAWAEYSESVTDAQAKSLLSFISAAETSVRAWCNRQFSYAQYTEYPVGSWTEKTMLLETPVYTTSMDIRVDYTRTWGTDTALTAGTDYFLDLNASDVISTNGILVRIGRVWEGYNYRPTRQLTYQKKPGRGMIKAVYFGGYTLTPDDLKLAIFQIVQQRLAARGLGVALQSESGMNYSYSRGPYDDEARQLMSVQQVVSRYQRGEALIG